MLRGCKCPVFSMPHSRSYKALFICTPLYICVYLEPIGWSVVSVPHPFHEYIRYIYRIHVYNIYSVLVIVDCCYVARWSFAGFYFIKIYICLNIWMYVIDILTKFFLYVFRYWDYPVCVSHSVSVCLNWIPFNFLFVSFSFLLCFIYRFIGAIVTYANIYIYRYIYIYIYSNKYI